MGKVYDALKRAEQERARRVTEAAAPLPSAEPLIPDAPEIAAPAAPVAPATERGWLKRRPIERADRVDETPNALNKRRYALIEPESQVAEQFRTLRGRIDAIASQQPLKTLAITSPLPREGKSTAAVNLAVVTAMSVGRRVLLVDCDLRHPIDHEALGVTPDAGLAEVLENQTSVDNAIVKVEGANLDALLVRGRPHNPSELLASERMREVIEELAQRYDRVIFDLPPALGMPDAKTVTELCDGIVLVVQADSTPREDVEAALDVLDRRRLLGLVLNGAEAGVERYDYR